MDQQAQFNIPFGLIYKILSCFDRRELCQLRNVNRRHYTVIENKFGTTAPYLVFYEQQNLYSMLTNVGVWKWRPALGDSYKKMPSDVRNQLPLSKFVRFKLSWLTVYNPIESNIDLLSMSHVWENQELSIECGPNYIWNEEWIHIAAKAKDLQLEAIDLFPYLCQLISGNCVCLSITDWTDTLAAVELPWSHIIDFLFQPNPKEAKTISIFAHSPFDHHQRQTFEFIQQMKQTFLESRVPLDFYFEWETVELDELVAIDDFVVQNRRTKQSLRLYSTDDKFRLTVEKHDPPVIKVDTYTETGSSTSPMYIYVKTMTGSVINLDVEKSDRVDRVKEMIEDREGIPSSQQRLIFAGKQMSDDKNMSDYNVQNGSTMHLARALKGC